MDLEDVTQLIIVLSLASRYEGQGVHYLLVIG